MKLLLRPASLLIFLLHLSLSGISWAQAADTLDDNLIQQGYIEQPADEPVYLTAENISLLDYARFSARSGDLSEYVRNMRSIAFNGDGTRVYIVGRHSTNVSEYHLSIPWDIQSESFSRELDLSHLDSGTLGEVLPHGIYIRDNGRKMWIFNRQEIWEFDLSIAWDVSSAVSAGHVDFSADIERGHGIHFRSNGMVLYIDDREGEKIVQYSLSTAWDISSATYDEELDLSGVQDQVRGIQLTPDGTRLFLNDTGRFEILEYYLSSPHNVSSASLIGTFDTRGNTDNPRGITFNSDFSKFYVSDADRERIYQYDIVLPVLSVPDILAASNVTETGFRANWRSVGNVENYRFQVSTSNGFDSSDIVEQRDLTSTNYDVTGLATNQTYYYRVRAQSSTLENSDYSDTESVRVFTINENASSVAASPEKILSDGEQRSTITVTIRDENDDAIPGVNVDLNPNGGSSSIRVEQQATNSNGRAIFSVSNSTPESVTYTATAAGRTISQQATVSFVTIDPAFSLVSADPESVQANGEEESTITVTAIDEDGDLLEGVAVSLSVSGGSSQLSHSQRTTNPDGEAFFTVKNSVAEQVEYTARAGGRNIIQTATVSFIPRAPVSLAATNATTSSFRANWELVEGATNYILEISTDQNFNSFVEGYEGFDTGNNSTDYEVTGLSPGTVYYYRLRAVSGDLMGANSLTVNVATFPETPVAASATGASATLFTARWEQAEGAVQYRLDVSEEEDFSTRLEGYSNLNVADATEKVVDGLIPGRVYYYQVRAEAHGRVSSNSNRIQAETVSINTEESELAAEQLRVLANAEQENTITVTVRGDDGAPLPGVPVQLESESDNSEVSAVDDVTDEEGKISFKVKSGTPSTVEYNAVAAGVVAVGSISVEFIADGGVLALGDNFPNPFRGRTSIPVSVPERMHIRVDVISVLGTTVETLVDGELSTGYYEIPFEGGRYASGIYFYRLMTDQGVKVGKMALIK